MALHALSDERNRRARRREQQRLRTATPGLPPDSTEAAIQRELDRLTDENAHEVRARLKVLHGSQPETTDRRTPARNAMDGFLESLDRLGRAAWGQALQQDESLARRWEGAFRGMLPPEAWSSLARNHLIEKDWHLGHVGATMLSRATAQDPQAQELMARVRAFLARSGATAQGRP